MAKKSEDEKKKWDMNRIEQIEYAWKQNKKKAINTKKDKATDDAGPVAIDNKPMINKDT